MALVVNLQSTDDEKFWKLISTEKNQLMKLRDYLRDDLSSCSSSGFKSFPRRQCCTASRFHLEVDLKTGDSSSKSERALLKRSNSRSAVKRASEAVLSAVKQLTLSSKKSSPSSSVPKSRSRRGNLARSFSRRLLTFWKKSDRDDGEIGRSRSFTDFLDEEIQPSDPNVAAAITTASRVSSSSKSKSTNTISWSESEITADVLPSSSVNSESYSVTDGVEVKIDLPAKEVSNRIAVTAGEDSVKCTKEWRKEEGKEHFSPVSVLENPFEDEDDDDSPFQLHRAPAEGTKNKLLAKNRRLEKLAKIEPLDLEKRISSCGLEKVTEAEDLLKKLKSKTDLTNLKFSPDSALLDFFWERIAEGGAKNVVRFNFGCGKIEAELLKKAEEWVQGQCQELVLGWEVRQGRETYWKDVERNAEWWNLEEEKGELVAKMELEMFTSLVDELVFDFC